MIGQHVDIQGPEPGELFGQGHGVLIHPIPMMALEDDHQVGQCLLTYRIGDPEIDAGVGGDASHRHHVDVLDEQRAHSAGHHRGHGRGDLVDGGKRGQQGGLMLGARMETEDGPGDQGQGAFRPDDELGQVVAAGGLDEASTGSDHLAGPKHGLESEDVVTGDAVLDGSHTSGIGGHVAADAGRLLARKDGVHQSEGLESGVELVESHPWLHNGDLIGDIDFDDGAHAFEGDDHTASCGNRGSRQTGTGAPGGQRHALISGCLDDGHHLGGRSWPDHRNGTDRMGVERLVVAHVGRDGRPEVHVGPTHRRDQAVPDHLRLVLTTIVRPPLPSPDHANPWSSPTSGQPGPWSCPQIPRRCPWWRIGASGRPR